MSNLSDYRAPSSTRNQVLSGILTLWSTNLENIDVHFPFFKKQKKKTKHSCVVSVWVTTAHSPPRYWGSTSAQYWEHEGQPPASKHVHQNVTLLLFSVR